MESRREIATVRSYDELIEAFRARVEELSVSRLVLDDVAGFQPGYSGKVLGHGQVRSMGGMSFGTLLQALGLALVVVEDAEAMAAVCSRLQKRARAVPMPQFEASDPIQRIKLDGMRRNMQRARIARNKKLSPFERTRIARIAAAARWPKRKRRRLPVT